MVPAGLGCHGSSPDRSNTQRCAVSKSFEILNRSSSNCDSVGGTVRVGAVCVAMNMLHRSAHRYKGMGLKSSNWLISSKSSQVIPASSITLPAIHSINRPNTTSPHKIPRIHFTKCNSFNSFFRLFCPGASSSRLLGRSLVEYVYLPLSPSKVRAYRSCRNVAFSITHAIGTIQLVVVWGLPPATMIIRYVACIRYCFGHWMLSRLIFYTQCTKEGNSCNYNSKDLITSCS